MNPNKYMNIKNVIEKIFIVDDHDLFRLGLKKLLLRHGYDVVGDSEDTPDVLLQLERLGVTLLILDLEMPNIHGVQIFEKIQSLNKKPKVLILSQSDRLDHIINLLKIGQISGYILKSEGQEDFLLAISEISKGKYFFGRKVAVELFLCLQETIRDSKLELPSMKNDKRSFIETEKGSPVFFEKFKDDIQDKQIVKNKDSLSIFSEPNMTSSIKSHFELTQRQCDVLSYVATGKTVREIAKLLNCSENTIKTHKSVIMKKIQARNSTELSAWYWNYYHQKNKN
jgi:DNA-binding NarL/FixJ family response regulator